MAQTIRIQLPDGLYAPLQRIADATRRPLEELVVAALSASLPPLDGLPSAMVDELVQLETLGDTDLWDVMIETVPVAMQEELDALLQANQAGTLGDAGRARLAELQRDADRTMLRRGRAAVLLRFRGHRLPTLAEMRRVDTAAE